MAIFVDLVLDNGRVVRVEAPSKVEDELHDSLETAMQVGGWWAPARFEGCKAEYLGNLLDRVNMARVVGRM